MHTTRFAASTPAAGVPLPQVNRVVLSYYILDVPYTINSWYHLSHKREQYHIQAIDVLYE